MSFIIDINAFYGYKRTLHCLRMMKRFYDAGYDVKNATEHFTLHATNTYGWSFEGEPIHLFLSLVPSIFPGATIYSEYDEEDLISKEEVFKRMVIPTAYKDKLPLKTLDTCAIIYIDKEDFTGVDFHFDKKHSKSNTNNDNYFETDYDGLPIYHFRNKELSELVICIDLDFYAQNGDSLLEFTLWIKQQLEAR